MIADPIFLGIIGISAFSHLIAFMLGRLLGFSAAYESLRPPPSSDWGNDLRTSSLANELFHSGTLSTGVEHDHA